MWCFGGEYRGTRARGWSDSLCAVPRPEGGGGTGFCVAGSDKESIPARHIALDNRPTLWHYQSHGYPADEMGGFPILVWASRCKTAPTRSSARHQGRQMRKHIYIRQADEGIWGEIEEAAAKLDRSLGWYLVDCHRQMAEVTHDIEAGAALTQPVEGTPEYPDTAMGAAARSQHRKAPPSRRKEIVSDIQGQMDAITQPRMSVGNVPFNPQPKDKDRKK